jgi:diguanylate cyclase (GGDEF)-like protein
METTDGVTSTRPALRPAPRRARNRLVLWLLTAAVWGAGFGLYTTGVQGLGALPGPVSIPWWLFVVAFAGTEIAVVHLHFRHSTQTFSLSEVPLVIGLFFLSPPLLFLARMLGGGTALYLQWRRLSIKLLFNLGVFAVETAAAIALFRFALGAAPPTGGRARLAAFTAAVLTGMMATVLVAVASSLHDIKLQRKVWTRMLLTGVVAFTANASLGLVAVTVLQVAVSAVSYLVIVVVLVFVAYRAYSTIHRRNEDLELLYDFTRAVGGALHVDSVGLRLLVRARDLLRAEHAELILANIDGAGGTARLCLTDDGRLEQIPDPADERELRTAAFSGDSVVMARGTKDLAQRAYLDRVGHKDVVAVALRPDDSTAQHPGVTGTLLVANRLGDVITFTGEDVRLLETLANHASVALANGRLVDRLYDQAAEREHEALHDAETGLPNRTMFQQQLTETITAPGAKAAVLLMDLNNFKDVNDTLGHQAGDKLLRDIAGRLQRALDGTGMVARLGGDEFAVLLPGVGGELAAKTVAHEVLTVLEQHTTIEGVRVDIGASIGITLCPVHGREATTLLRRADVAMYSAKSSHSAIEVYNSERDYHSPERLALVGELRSTLERGELRVAYQPKADLRTGRVVGVEALARWNHPQHGFVPPEEFVGVAERSGLIQPLTRHVLRTALTQCRLWRLGGLSLNVSVNISARSLLPDLPREIARILGETGVSAATLTLEITESSIMADPERTNQVLQELSSMGVHISIDDFGTGYSSLSHLKRLPVDEIKIDKSFVLGMSRDDGDAAIVRSTVDLGRNLGLRVVAEGIEDAATWTALTTMGCDMAQGFYLTPPVSPTEFDTWLRARIDSGGVATATRPTEVVLDPIDPPGRRLP